MDIELVEKFIEVTGESAAMARLYLSVTDGNVEAAISLMFERGQVPEEEHVNPEPEVRPPILPTQEILVPADPVCSFPSSSNNVFDRFRDFAVETQRQEEELSRRVAGIHHISQRISKRLEDLFRPPCSILFLGSFLEAREHAKTLNRWLLVNIQNSQEFACQILNRDVWSNQQIREIVKDHFVLWQVLSNTGDGKRYIDFYNVSEYPYLAVIDPRTGECMKIYNHITVDILISALNDMLSTHPSPECVTTDPFSSKTWNNCTATATKENPMSSSTISDCSSSSTKTSKHVIDNLNDPDSHNGVTNIQSSTSTSSSSTSTAIDDSENINKKRRMNESDLKKQNEGISSKDTSCKPKYQLNEIKPNSEPISLCLRLPNGNRETLSMYAANTVEDFINKMESLGYVSSDHSYLVPFPKTNIGELAPEIRLSDTVLFPTNTVFITKL